MSSPLTKIFLLSVAFGTTIFLCSCGDSAHEEISHLTVDGESALQFAKDIVNIGPRPSGSTNAQKTAQHIYTICAKNGYESQVETWQEKTPKGMITFRNVYAILPGKSSKFLLLGSHYDTKEIPGIPEFIGANDSASSTALLLEIMRVLRSKELPLSIRFAFFDGEEAREQYSTEDGLHGSKHLASALQKSGEYLHCEAMILLDMIGDKDISITISPDDDANLTKHLFAITRRQQTEEYFGIFLHGNILDDHVPFKQLGIPAIDIIDFQYGPNNSYWHTRLDTIDKLSSRSMEIVGNAVIQLVIELSMKGKK